MTKITTPSTLSILIYSIDKSHAKVSPESYSTSSYPQASNYYNDPPPDYSVAPPAAIAAPVSGQDPQIYQYAGGQPPIYSSGPPPGGPVTPVTVQNQMCDPYPNSYVASGHHVGSVDFYYFLCLVV